MMNDYVFLEDIGRKVADWGNEIVRGGYMNVTNMRGRGGRRGAVARGKGTRTKKDVLKLQLEAQDIEMEQLAHGMERKRANQSFWDFKKKTAQLTIEFKLHVPTEPPFRMLTHRNDMNTPLLKLVQTHVSNAKKSHVPPWAKSLVTPDAESPPPYFVMPAQRDDYPTVELVTHPNKSVYYQFNPTQPFSTLLKGTQFVEFPTIEVFEEFKGTVIDTAGFVSRIGDVNDQPRVKRRKIAMQSILGEYGSGEEDQEDAGVRNEPRMLVEYTDSVSEEGEESAEESDEMDGGDVDVKVDPSVLLQLIHEARDSGRWEDEEVEWSEGTEEGVRDPVGAGLAGLS
ncbi:hypothetical protein APHAL10511_002103 [Amanita phalloides]|nr:hypothetical protein APHAL10511_002103 [Amanita phalloides]